MNSNTGGGAAVSSGAGYQARVAGYSIAACICGIDSELVPAGGLAAMLAFQIVVNVGHDRSTFAVSDGRVCEFTRVLGWGGQSLSVAIEMVWMTLASTCLASRPKTRAKIKSPINTVISLPQT